MIPEIDLPAFAAAAVAAGTGGWIAQGRPVVRGPHA